MRPTRPSVRQSQGTALYWLHKGAGPFLLVLMLLSHGCPPQRIVAAFGLGWHTVTAWLVRAAAPCGKVRAHLVAVMGLGHV